MADLYLVVGIEWPLQPGNQLHRIMMQFIDYQGRPLVVLGKNADHMDRMGGIVTSFQVCQKVASYCLVLVNRNCTT
jgi:hypothetical protein